MGRMELPLKEGRKAGQTLQTMTKIKAARFLPGKLPQRTNNPSGVLEHALESR